MDHVKTKLVLAVMFGSLIAGLYVSISTAVIVLLLGLLLVPPGLVLVSIIVEGALIITEKLKRLAESEKNRPEVVIPT